MNNKLTAFQAVILGVCVILAVVAVIVFAGKKFSGDEKIAPVTVWGTLSDADMLELTSYLADQNKNIQISYVQKTPEEFDQDFVEALASGSGPDLVFLPDDLIVRHSNKLYTIPYQSYTRRQFQDSFVEGSEIFLSNEGVKALPFMIDPLVMYWNRSLYSAAGIAKPPMYWDEVQTNISKLASIDQNKRIARGAIALGEFVNIDNAFEIFMSLIMQAGGKIAGINEQGRYISLLKDKANQTLMPTEAALLFFTQFSDPTKNTYTWSRALPRSKDMFVSGSLASYLGFASEISTLSEKNSNLNYDVVEIPQTRGSQGKITYGKFVGLGIIKSSPNLQSAIDISFILTSAESLDFWRKEVSQLPPVRRDLLADVPSDFYSPVFYNAALSAHSFYNPDPASVPGIIQKMFESYVSGQTSAASAIDRADREITLLFDRYF